MSFLVETRLSDSPYVETVMHGRTARAGTTIRPAESHWHMVFVCINDSLQARVVGPWTTAGELAYIEGIELLWIKFRLGVFMPHRPLRDFLNTETILPAAADHAFWLHSAAWQLPNYENADTFVNRLAREEVLAYDPLVNAVLQDESPAYAARTLRHRFLWATGLTQKHIQQVERAQRAESLLQQGVSILDATHELGYYDQPHLTRSLKQWIGHTPAQLLRSQQPG